MKKLFAAYIDISRALKAAFCTPRVLALLLVAALVAAAGAMIFRFLEGWTLIDSFYFAVVSMATVGYGDLAPKTNAGKLFTIAFLVVGIGIFVLAVSSLAEAVIRALQSQKEKD
jgi:voltage-gated potassium channel Kch